MSQVCSFLPLKICETNLELSLSFLRMKSITFPIRTMGQVLTTLSDSVTQQNLVLYTPNFLYELQQNEGFFVFSVPDLDIVCSETSDLNGFSERRRGPKDQETKGHLTRRLDIFIHFFLFDPVRFTFWSCTTFFIQMPPGRVLGCASFENLNLEDCVRIDLPEQNWLWSQNTKQHCTTCLC